MQRKNSKSKINGKIIMMQNDLMSKLSSIEAPNKAVDELGFSSRGPQFDSLTNLLSKAKGVTSSNQQKIEEAKRKSTIVKGNTGKAPKRTSVKIEPTKNSSNKQSANEGGTFLTGVGLGISHPQQDQAPAEQEQDQASTVNRQMHRQFYSDPTIYQEQDPDEMIKEMIRKNNQDDLAQLRRMIKETDSSLQSYGRQLHKTRKDVMGMAEKFTDIDPHLVDKICYSTASSNQSRAGYQCY